MLHVPVAHISPLDPPSLIFTKGLHDREMETYFSSYAASKEKSPPYIKRASLLTDQLSLLSQSYYQDNWAAPVSVSLEREEGSTYQIQR